MYARAMSLGRSIFALACLSLVGCPSAPGPGASEPSQTAPSADPSAPPRDDDPPVACAKDEDCGSLACGPCTSGDVVRVSKQRMGCVVNPCPGATSVCRNKVCVVK